MNKKYAYCTAITKELYIPYIIFNKRLMDYLNVKYPLIVLISDNISKQAIAEMEKYNIIVKNSPLIKLNHQADYAVNFSSLLLEEYDLIFTFEADIVLLENLDYLFTIIDDTTTIDNKLILFSKKKSLFLEPVSFYFFCRPSLQEYQFFKSIAAITNSEHDIVRTYYTKDIWLSTFPRTSYKKVNFYFKHIHFSGNHIKGECLVRDFTHLEFIQDIFFNSTMPLGFLFAFLFMNMDDFITSAYFAKTNITNLNSKYLLSKQSYLKSKI